jgi:SAM-dependent methyltransferase
LFDGAASDAILNRDCAPLPPLDQASGPFARPDSYLLEMVGSLSRAAVRRARFHAWWDGIDPPPLLDLDSEPLLLDRLAPLEPNGVTKAWSPQRIEAAERIWGRDFVVPGGAAFTIQLAKPFGAGPQTSLCDLHAGLGGGTRAIAKTFGVWVTGLEPDPDLADAANRRSRAQALDRKAPIQTYDPAGLALAPESFDGAFAREGFCQVADKQRLLDGVVAGLRDRGQLIFTDLVLADKAGASAGLEAGADPWPIGRMAEALAERRLDVRIRQDITTLYRGLVRAGFKTLLGDIQRGTIGRPALAPVLAEAERWARRVAALDRGLLRCYRFHAIKGPGKRPGKSPGRPLGKRAG